MGESPEQIAESARQPKGLIPIIPRKRPASPLLPGYGGHEMEHDRDVACAVPQMCLQRTTGAGGTPDVPFGVPLAASSAATVRQRSGRRIPPRGWQGARLGTGHKVRKLREFVKHLIDGTDVDREMSPNTGTRPLLPLSSPVSRRKLVGIASKLAWASTTVSRPAVQGVNPDVETVKALAEGGQHGVQTL